MLERGTQVVGHGVGERLQVPVRGRQLGGAVLNTTLQFGIQTPQVFFRPLAAFLLVQVVQAERDVLHDFVQKGDLRVAEEIQLSRVQVQRAADMIVEPERK